MGAGAGLAGQLSTDDCTKDSETHPKQCARNIKIDTLFSLYFILPEYSGSVWDPSGVGLQSELEKVQNRAARFVTGNYNFETGIMTGILGHLKWESLKKRRRDSRLIVVQRSEG